MIREDVTIKIISPEKAEIKTTNNSFEIDTCDKMQVYTTSRLEMKALDDIEKSQIVIIEQYSIDNDSVTFSMTKRFGFTIYKFIDVMIFIIEKYNL